MDFPRPPRRLSSSQQNSISRRQGSENCDGEFLATPLPPSPNTSIASAELEAENTSNGSTTSSLAAVSGLSTNALLRCMTEHQKQVDRRLSEIEKCLKETKKSLDDLTDLVKNNMKESFSIRGSRYEVSTTLSDHINSNIDHNTKHIAFHMYNCDSMH